MRSACVIALVLCVAMGAAGLSPPSPAGGEARAGPLLRLAGGVPVERHAAGREWWRARGGLGEAFANG